MEEAGWRFFENKDGKATIKLESSIKLDDLGDDYVALTQLPNYKDIPEFNDEKKKKDLIANLKLRFLRHYQVEAIKAIFLFLSNLLKTVYMRFRSGTFLFFSLLGITSCIDRITIKMPQLPSTLFTVDGLITNEPGPYTVKLTSAIRADGGLTRGGEAVSANKITLLDNVGNEEVMSEIDKGTYQTKANGIRGVIGKEYHIRIEATDGTVYESLPDMMNPVGEVDTIYHKFESFQPDDLPTEYGYRIFIDAHDTPNGNNYVRWRFTGTYIIETLPQYTICLTGCSYCPAVCSAFAFVDGQLKEGYAYNPSTGKYEYVVGLKCSCCRCWVTKQEDRPHVSDNQFVVNGKFKNVQMGFVPVNFYTFFEKYRVEVMQMSLSRFAFDYWRAIQAQKESSNSLFQPISGKIHTNIVESNGSKEAMGIFYASAVTKKQIYISKDENKTDALVRVPVDCLGRVGAMGKDCRLAFPFSSLQAPPDWK
jgi:hypothetical protein